MDDLIIFDFDFTLAKTVEHIWIESPRGSLVQDGKSYIRLHPTELQQLGISDDECLNENSFKEFYSLNTDKIQIIKPIMNYLKYYSHIGKVFILTARPHSLSKDVLNFLQTHNINTKNLEYKGLTNSSFMAKINWIKERISKHKYNKIILFEDNKKIIDYLLLNKEITLGKEIYYISNFSDKTIISCYDRT